MRLSLRWGVAVVAVIVAALLRLGLTALVGDLPLFITFYPAVALVALFAGGRAGAVATILSAIAADWWFLSPYGALSIGAGANAVALTLFTGSGLLISLMAGMLRRARQRATMAGERERAATELARANQRLETALNSITDGYYALDDQWRFTAANRLAGEHFGPAGGSTHRAEHLDAHCGDRGFAAATAL